MTKPKEEFTPTVQQVEDAVVSDDNMGWCRECGEEAFGVEPDAQKYQCEACDAWAVYGAEEYVMNGWVK